MVFVFGPKLRSIDPICAVCYVTIAQGNMVNKATAARVNVANLTARRRLVQKDPALLIKVEQFLKDAIFHRDAASEECVGNGSEC